MSSLVRHLHGFCKDVNLQHGKFLDGCEYLKPAGQTCDENRQEFILLGDILGVEVLVDMLSNPIDGPESESTVLGPFYREKARGLSEEVTSAVKDIIAMLPNPSLKPAMRLIDGAEITMNGSVLH